jgi:hypothetical protein
MAGIASHPAGKKKPSKTSSASVGTYRLSVEIIGLLPASDGDYVAAR